MILSESQKLYSQYMWHDLKSKKFLVKQPVFLSGANGKYELGMKVTANIFVFEDGRYTENGVDSLHFGGWTHWAYVDQKLEDVRKLNYLK